MLLDLTRALSFFLSLVSLYWVTISAFFAPGTTLQERLITALLRLAFAACISFFSGLLSPGPPAPTASPINRSCPPSPCSSSFGPSPESSCFS